MALQRQGSGTWPMGINASSNGDHKVVGILRPSPGHSRMYDGGRSDQNGLRGSNLKNISRLAKVKRASHSWRFLPCSVPCILVVCLLGLVASVFISHAISHALVGDRSFPQQNENDGQQSVVWIDNGGIRKDGGGNQDYNRQDVQKKPESGSLYNERGRNELVEIGARIEDRLDQKEELHLEKLQPEFDEYDDDGGELEVEKKLEVVDSNDESRRVVGLKGEAGTIQADAEGVKSVIDKLEDQRSETSTSKYLNAGVGDVQVDNRDDFQKSLVQKHPRTKKRRHTATPPCEIDFLPTTEGLEEPQEDAAFVNISLSYVQSEVRPLRDPNWVAKFGGHQSLEEREKSFYAEDQTLHCGFVKAPDGEPWTGFELSESDKEYLDTCHIAVSSCIFGAWDNLRTPTNKKMSNSSKARVCFVMFVDQKSLDAIKQDGQTPNDKGILGLWKIVLIKNLPYQDGRRNGKIPKLLTHRLFPNARYSVWLDSKLRLHADPLLILERFLWRGDHEYAISNHYDRHCVWEEVSQNKKLNKFNHSIIDEQFQFYQREGLPRFNKSDPNRYLPSHVPEGSFIVRAHTPMANLFSCLWFNEVERFTPRDQLSFAATYIKLVRINPTKKFRLNMFKDCERKAMAKLFHHRLDAVAATART
ncbi:probable hexosyltransferase MUCI70 isoform X2 [Physcomitrium patens]|uniref:TOD1/MUCI70 glycosyltransferase-like domain-containing protein n=1 Tax=Physcomitrium patens TaxID=3218 RepID=A0A2K1IDB7_PHYPA|nr:uncharacterized protein LOC112277434 isoform X2 [Physcomitrium patens]PNR27273.1 hypothetical protein PHYPA_029425 [Physcomitrium patens]|eukprot:XP_024365499.1 uncharacterized protein LOC112277434 isoform X2 [Physcomitrella patens]